ncbi:hypothetical protein AB0F17_50865 [Nonomuraea sp. NPDC026600]|uniref:hypothetical protein n=1 Tax=Nonomuraea sp. NPDC026600 TaxID=3155363 RepID=UPI003400C527
MKRLLEGTPLRAGVVAAVALAGGLLGAAPAAAVAGERTVVSVVQTAAVARPSNGKILYHGLGGGLGTLKIKNGTSRDGVVTLVKGKTKAVSIYVRARSTASVKDVRDGTYRVYFTTGSRFSTSKGRFSRSAVYQRFNDRLKFTTTATSARVWTLTLNPVRGGNARTSSINPKDFPA